MAAFAFSTAYSGAARDLALSGDTDAGKTSPKAIRATCTAFPRMSFAPSSPNSKGDVKSSHRYMLRAGHKKRDRKQHTITQISQSFWFGKYLCNLCNPWQLLLFQLSIREQPETWLWRHRRWKNQPEGHPGDMYSVSPVGVCALLSFFLRCC